MYKPTVHRDACINSYETEAALTLAGLHRVLIIQFKAMGMISKIEPSHSEFNHTGSVNLSQASAVYP